MTDTLNDIVWRKIFDKYNILEKIKKNKVFEITSSQINPHRQARLATKFDHRRNLPEIFKENKLSILPTSRGSYLIAQFEAYHDFEEKETEIIKIEFPTHIESIDYENITSEAAALNCAYVSGILDDFIEDEGILPTVAGRMSSDVFDFYINTYSGSKFRVNVTNAQIEIDGGYEGFETLALIEAKNSLSDDFIIRQIYYPYRLWKDKVSKKVKPIFMTYSNGIFTLYEYEFQDHNDYNSLILVKQRRYTIEETEIDLEDIMDIYRRTEIVEEPRVPFPQADSFERVINLCELLYESDLTKDKITETYDFDPRQSDYYTNAGRYLGLVKRYYTEKDDGKRKTAFTLTKEGEKFFKLKHKQRQLKLVELILSHRVFREVFEICIETGEMPDKAKVVEIMKRCNLYNIKSEDTFDRRSQSIISWVKWIFGLTKL